jgi:hypothetical protein
MLRIAKFPRGQTYLKPTITVQCSVVFLDDILLSCGQITNHSNSGEVSPMNQRGTRTK